MPRAGTSRSNRPSRSSSSASTAKKHSRSSSALPKTEVIINVYDLLPQGAVSSLLWTTGFPLLHTGVVLNNREYAYGATASSLETQSGIFWTRPRFEPPGATFRCSVLQGFTYLTPKEIESVLVEASNHFPGDEYNLLTYNCNHFTNYLCQVLTQRNAPTWINRASKVGTMLPCLVPKEWVTPPEADWSDQEEHSQEDESSSMMRSYRASQSEGDRESHNGHRNSDVRDREGRDLPPSEQAPNERLV